MRFRFSFLLLFTNILSFAQPGMGDPPEEIPITDHIEILFVAFLFLGIYIIIRNKKKSQIKSLTEKSI